MAEKKALKSQVYATQAEIEKNNIESVKNQLVGSNQELLQSLNNDLPADNYVFRDYGICPFAASRCDSGGEKVHGTKVFSPAPAGYSGIQNCLRCRHFITGLVFLGGILSVTNEIRLEANSQSQICQHTQVKVQAVNDNIDELDRQEYVANLKQKSFDASQRPSLKLKVRKLESEYENAAKKMDMLLCDLQSAYKLIQQCQFVTNSQIESDDTNLALIKKPEPEIQIQIDETSYFQQLHEICENATIYDGSNPSRAITPRSQLLDRMASFNDLAPQLFMLSQEQQLSVGSQLFALLKARLKSWEKVNDLIDGHLRLSDFMEPGIIEPSEIELITKDARSALSQGQS